MESLCRRILPSGPELQSQFHRSRYRSRSSTTAVFRRSDGGQASRRLALPLRSRAIGSTANWHFVDNYSWKSGKHDIKFGYEFRRTTITQVIDHNFRGTLSFGNDVSAELDRPLTALQAFLEGIPDGGNQVAGNSRRHTFQNSHGLFLQDSFRATSRLTLNYGMRWDYFGVTGEKNNQFYTVVPNSPAGSTTFRPISCTARTSTTSLRAWPLPTT